jgi:signal peptidase II
MLITMNLKNINKGYIIAFVTILLVILDQVVKMLVHFNLEAPIYNEAGDLMWHDSREIFSWFNIQYIENRGFAYGMEIGGEGAVWGKIVLSLFRLVMIGAIIYGIHKLLKRGNVPNGIFAGAVLILAGAIGNMVDCMFYGWMLDSQDAGFLMGDVVDMFHFPLFKWENCPEFLSFLVGSDGYFFGAVFNVADAYISIAVVYLLLFHYKFFSSDKQEQKAEK